LARLAGLTPAAVIVEILNDDGSMARRPDLEQFAAQYGLKIGTIADLIQYRVRNEHTVERVTECNLSTEYGDFRLVAFQDMVDNDLHLALVKGQPSPEKPTLVRVHVQNSLCDLFAAQGGECGWPLRNAMRQINEAGEGVIVVLRNHDMPREIIQRMMGMQMQAASNKGFTKKDNSKELRTYGAGAQILTNLGVRKMRVLSAPKSILGLSGFDMEVTEYVDCQ
jgi:3,4-dihydroxy 2-butanone 4-phosphate synthase/GTP cyclohydrolase II